MKKVLIITYYWPPAGGPGVQRWLKFAKYLPDFYYTPIVLTVKPEKAEYPIMDETLLGDVREEQVVYRTDFSGLYDKYKKLTKAKTAPYSGFVNEENPGFKQKFARFIRGNFFLPDARKGWNKHAYAKAVDIIKDEKVDVVITTGPPMSTHLIGRKLKENFDVMWVSDFRDPWTDIFYYNKMYPTRLAKYIDKKYEKSVLEKSDAVITVSEKNRQQLLSKSDKLEAGKFHIITNGFDEVDFDFEEKKDEIFTITYTGTLTSTGLPLDAFISSFKRLSESENIKLRLVGKIHNDIKQKLEGAENVEYHSFVPHDKAIRYMKSSSMLLLFIPHIGNLPGKLYEYLGSETPIVCIGYPESDAANIISACNAGETFNYDDEEGIYNYLYKKVIDFKTGNLKVDTSVIHKYSRKKLTRNLSLILNER